MIIQIWILTWLEITDMSGQIPSLAFKIKQPSSLKWMRSPKKSSFFEQPKSLTLSTISTMNLTNLRWQKLALSEHVITKRHMKRSTLHYCFKPKAMTFQSDRESFDNERTTALNEQLLKRKSFYRLQIDLRDPFTGKG
jgi:hypothetical protein